MSGIERVSTVAVLGTGIMGAPMARNLATAGLDVWAWNRTRAKAEPLAREGVTVAETPEEAVSGAELVITMLADGDAVAETAHAVLPRAAPSAIWLQMSTVGLAAAERLAALAAEHGVLFVDAPVLGTKQPAEQGELVVLAGSREDVRERCAPVFDAVGAKTVWLGAPPAASRLKLVLNNWVTSLVEVVAETIGLARALDIPPERFLETIAGGPLDVPNAQMKGRAMISGELEPSFSLDLARKDVGLVLAAAEEHGLELPVTRAVASQFATAIQLGHGAEDMAACVYASAPGS